jgi:L-malate glycosyltransferase
MTVTATSERPAGIASANGRIRVLWLIKGLDPGGAEVLLASMAEVRDRQGFDYEAAYLLPWKNGLVGELQGQDVDVHCLNGGKEWDLRWAIQLRRLLVARPFDIVHVHSPYVAGIARLVIRGLPRRSRPRVVSTEHVPWWGYVAPSRYLNALTFGLDDAHVAVSRAVAASISRRHARGTRVVVHGIFPDRLQAERRFRDPMRRELGVGDGEILIGTVANFRPQKGYPDLLRAARRVIDDGLPVRFIAVGRGPQEQEIGELHRTLDLGDRFILAGYRRDATRVLAACDVFVLSSLFEGLPIALMEALALGLPVVATRVAGITECVTDGVEGLLVPPSRPDLLAGAVEAVVRDEDLRGRMGRAAARRGRRFDIKEAARRVEDIYREVVRT